MSVQGFTVNGNIEKYDFNSLDNIPSYGTYSKPSDGIPSTDMTSAVQTSLGKADSAYQKPSGGIPSTDLASGVIPTVPSSAADIGAIPAPSSPSSGQFLVYNGSAWVAQTVPSANGVSF